MNTPSLHSLRDASPTPLQGAEPALKRSGGPFVGWRGAGPVARRGLQGSPLAGETLATAIAGVACSAAFGVLGFHRLRVARSVMDH